MALEGPCEYPRRPSSTAAFKNHDKDTKTPRLMKNFVSLCLCGESFLLPLESEPRVGTL